MESIFFSDPVYDLYGVLRPEHMPGHIVQKTWRPSGQFITSAKTHTVTLMFNNTYESPLGWTCMSAEYRGKRVDTVKTHRNAQKTHKDVQLPFVMLFLYTQVESYNVALSIHLHDVL